MRCSRCATENPAGKKFCGGCGSTLSARCPRCGAENTPSFKFCGDCGASLYERGSITRDEVSASALSSVHVAADASEPLEGERKTVTALFADIKGSMELMENLDPDRRRHLRIVRRAGGPLGPFAARTSCGAGDAGGVASLRRAATRGGQDSCLSSFTAGLSIGFRLLCAQHLGQRRSRRADVAVYGSVRGPRQILHRIGLPTRRRLRRSSAHDPRATLVIAIRVGGQSSLRQCR